MGLVLLFYGDSMAIMEIHVACTVVYGLRFKNKFTVGKISMIKCNYSRQLFGIATTINILRKVGCT